MRKPTVQPSETVCKEVLSARLGAYEERVNFLQLYNGQSNSPGTENKIASCIMCTWAPSYGEDGKVEVELATGTSSWRVSGLCIE
jgi:hypothetical protein